MQVLRLVKLVPAPVSAVEVTRQLSRRSGRVSAATVYRNLAWLERRGEIASFEDHRGIRRFIGHAYHQAVFRCQQCGRQQVRHDQPPPASITSWLSSQSKILSTYTFAGGLCASCAHKPYD